jgi:hypothetical protein
VYQEYGTEDKRGAQCPISHKTLLKKTLSPAVAWKCSMSTHHGRHCGAITGVVERLCFGFGCLRLWLFSSNVRAADIVLCICCFWLLHKYFFLSFFFGYRWGPVGGGGWLSGGGCVLSVACICWLGSACFQHSLARSIGSSRRVPSD